MTANTNRRLITLTPSEREEVAAAAHLDGLPAATWMRATILRVARERLRELADNARTAAALAPGPGAT